VGTGIILIGLILLFLFWPFRSEASSEYAEANLNPSPGEGRAEKILNESAARKRLEILKYRALCPGCGKRLSRRLCLRSPRARLCEGCGCMHIADPVCERKGNMIGGTLLAFAVCITFLISWQLAFATFVFALLLAFWLFPYVSKFVIVSEREKSTEPRAHKNAMTGARSA
jgi:hypothetical protein